MSTRADREALTAHGLRRLVLHARDQLAAAAPVAPAQTNVRDDRGRAHVQATAAHTLALSVLQLVADVLPPGVDLKALQAEVETLRPLDDQLGEFMSVAERAGCADATDPSELERLIDDLKTERRDLLAAAAKP